MANLRDIRRRIGSIRKTRQITRAMRMVAGAKLRRAQSAIESARPYADRMRETLARVAAAESAAEHPLLARRERVGRVEVVVVTSDRGLCGGFNANTLKHAEAEIRRHEAAGAEVRITPVGRKVGDFFRRRRRAQLGAVTLQDSWVTYGRAVSIASAAAERFVAGEVDLVLLVYSEFVSVMTQRPRTVQLLPVSLPPGVDDEGAVPYQIEPSPDRFLALLVPRAVQVEVFRALLESQAGEHAARMAAMEAATRNTEELIEKLTLQFNRARQAAITKELMEIVSGAEAL